MGQYANLDASATVFFNRELERVKSGVWETKYDDLKARTIFPVDNQGGAGVDTVVVQVIDQVGMAKIISAYADDLPRADASAKEERYPVRTLGISFGYSVQEIRASQMVNKPLEQRKANAARRGVEQAINDIAFNGDTASGLGGFLNNANIPVGNVVNGANGTPEWSTKTPDEILFDINDMFADVFESTKMVERPSKLLLPVAQYSYISSTPRSANSDTTILQYIINNSQYINSGNDVIPLNELAGIGAGSSDVMIAYDPNPEKMSLDIPHELEFLPVQEKGLEYVVPGFSRIGGLAIYYPLSVSRREGI